MYIIAVKVQSKEKVGFFRLQFPKGLQVRLLDLNKLRNLLTWLQDATFNRIDIIQLSNKFLYLNLCMCIEILFNAFEKQLQ